MVAQIMPRMFGGNFLICPVLRKFTSSQSSNFFLRTGETCSELPSNISTVQVTNFYFFIMVTMNPRELISFNDLSERGMKERDSVWLCV